jgi:hypothetical protein
LNCLQKTCQTIKPKTNTVRKEAKQALSETGIVVPEQKAEPKLRSSLKNEYPYIPDVVVGSEKQKCGLKYVI